MLNRIVALKGDYNVIGVDWSAGAKKAYPKAVANTRVVGAVITRLVDVLKYKFDLKVKDLHLIGHSLGAHIAGYVGQKVPGLSRITGKYVITKNPLTWMINLKLHTALRSAM